VRLDKTEGNWSPKKAKTAAPKKSAVKRKLKRRR